MGGFWREEPKKRKEGNLFGVTQRKGDSNPPQFHQGIFWTRCQRDAPAGGATLRETRALFTAGIVHHLTEDFHGQPTLYCESLSLKFCKKKRKKKRRDTLVLWPEIQTESSDPGTNLGGGL